MTEESFVSPRLQRFFDAVPLHLQSPSDFSELVVCSEGVFHHWSLERKRIYGMGSVRHQLSTYQSECVSTHRSEMEAHNWS